MKKEILFELAAQAGFNVAVLSAPYPGGFPREDMLALESFGDLVVEKCIEKAGLPADNSIKQYFG